MPPVEPAPNAPCPPAALARRLRVGVEEVRHWCDEGLIASEGLIDPFAAVAWLADGRLHRCPLLADRWRRWAAFMADPCGRRFTCSWIRRAYLPPGVRADWDLPAWEESSAQRIAEVQGNAGVAPSGSLVVERSAAVAPAAGLARLAMEIGGSFRYGYRRHRHGDFAVAPPISGTCLDLALALAHELRRQGRPWRLRGGVIARTGLANPHVWIEAEGAAGTWEGVDATPIAVARMRGLDPASAPCHAPGGTVVAFAVAPSSSIEDQVAWYNGRVTAAGSDVAESTDWAQGECAWSFRWERRLQPAGSEAG